LTDEPFRYTLRAMIDTFANLTTIFLGIFIEAVPFLLLGSVASGLVEVFVDQNDLARWFPRRAVTAAFAGGLLGFVFPVCECGVVPLMQRLRQKGVPVSAGITFLLAAPIVNPIVIASTFVAYGFGAMLVARLILGLLVSVCVGLIFTLHPAPADMIRPRRVPPHADPTMLATANGMQRLGEALRIAGEEFFSMGRYLVFGAALAASLQILVPQKTLLDLGSGPVSSVLAMQTLAFVLSVCSTVDAFISLSFVNTFGPSAVLSFLVFGPMVDIKSTMMFLGVFRSRIVAYLILLPFLLVALATLFINLNFNWR